MAMRDRIMGTEATEPVVDTAVSENTEVATTEPTEVQEVPEEVEPDEASYRDPAEFKSALKEYTKKQTEKQLQKDYEKKLEGLYRDLRKQRGSKRELKEHINALEERLGTIATKLEGNNALKEPDFKDFSGNVDSYARAKAAWEINQHNMRQQSEKSKQQEIEIQQRNAQQEWTYKMAAAKERLPDIDQVIQRISAEGIGKYIKAPALESIRTSPVGPDIYHFLGNNPDVAEEIEDMTQQEQVMAVKQLEARLYNKQLSYGIPSTTTANAPGIVAPQATQTSTVATRKPAPTPPPRAGGTAASGSQKPITAATSTEDYIRRRLALKKQGKW